MNNNIIKKIQVIIYKLLDEKKSSKKEHIELVVKYSKILSKKLKADEEICVISAWLHDISKINGEDKGHHITGEKVAEEILLKLNYPKNKIEKVKHCILTHSSDENYKPKTLEAKIVASADAMSHFYNLKGLFYAAYGKRGLRSKEGKDWVLKKLEKSKKKMMPEAKLFVKNRHKQIIELLE